MDGIPPLKVTKVVRDDDVIKIFFAFWFPPDIDTPNKGWRERAWIGLDLKKMRIIPNMSTSWLLHEPYRQNPAWMLLAHPAIAIPFIMMYYLTWPVWFPLNQIHKKFKYGDGLTPLNRQLLAELKGKLEPEDAEILKTVLQNELRISNYLAKQVSFEKAWELLGSCDLRVTEYPEDSITKLEKVFYWFDEDGLCVAQAQLTKDGWHIFRVLGTDMNNLGDQARLNQLTSRCRSITTTKYAE